MITNQSICSTNELSGFYRKARYIRIGLKITITCRRLLLFKRVTFLALITYKMFLYSMLAIQVDGETIKEAEKIPVEECQLVNMKITLKNQHG